jgi:hypothetical protein
MPVIPFLIHINPYHVIPSDFFDIVLDSSRATSLTPNTQSTPPHPGPPAYYNIKTIHYIAVTTVLCSWRWLNDCPKQVELIQRSIKLLLLHLVGKFYYSPTLFTLYVCLFSSMRVACSAHLISLIFSVEKYWKRIWRLAHLLYRRPEAQDGLL